MNNIVEIDTATSKREIKTTVYYQYDKGLKVRLLNVPDQRDYQLKVEMCNRGDTEIKYTFPYSGGDIEIPHDLLTCGRDVQLFVFAKGEDWGKTVLDIVLSIVRRPFAEGR